MEAYTLETLALFTTVITLTTVRTQVTTNSIYPLWSAQSFPHPQRDPAACGRIRAGWVCDPSRIIGALKVNEVTVAQKIIEHTTQALDDACGMSTKQGYKMAAAIIGGIQNTNGQTPGPLMAANNFADHLRISRWRPGSCDNGLVVVVSLNTRTIGVSVGQRVQEKLSAQLAQRLAAQASTRLWPDTVGQELSWLLTKYENNLLNMDAAFAPAKAAMIVIASLVGVCIFVGVILSLIHCHTAREMKKKRRLLYESSLTKGNPIDA